MPERRSYSVFYSDWPYDICTVAVASEMEPRSVNCLMGRTQLGALRKHET